MKIKTGKKSLIKEIWIHFGTRNGTLNQTGINKKGHLLDIVTEKC